MATSNMYRVGDYVYFEVSASSPYQVRRIEELNKTITGAVEAKVACFFRRRDLTNTLLQQAQKYYSIDDFNSDDEETSNNEHSTASSPKPPSSVDDVAANGTENGNGKKTVTSLSTMQKHHIKHRELFLSRQVEVLPATHIRGKCSVTLYNGVEPLNNYLGRDDAFYYKLIYDPTQKTLQEDRGTLRIGLEFQCQIQPLLPDTTKDPRLQQTWEQICWDQQNHISEEDFKVFLTLCRSVGTLARAYDPVNLLAAKAGNLGPVCLLNAVTSASRDNSLQLSHNLLHDAKYKMSKAMHALVPQGQPLMCKDQLDEWSANEVQLFEEALEKYSKMFLDIQADYLPWKTQQAIVEMYYFWKTTDRYIKRRKAKLAAQEHKLKQVYIPHYNKPNQSVLFQNVVPPSQQAKKASAGCECCAASQSAQWYAWGPQNLVCKLCVSCWQYWKKFGGLKTLEASTKAMPSDREIRAQERLEAAAAAASTVSTATSPGGSAKSILDSVANGNHSINMPAANAALMRNVSSSKLHHHQLQHQQQQQQQQQQAQGPFGGQFPLVFEQPGAVIPHLGGATSATVGTVYQATSSFVKMTRRLALDWVRPKTLARCFARAPWLTGLSQEHAHQDYESLLQALLQSAKELMAEEGPKREQILDKLSAGPKLKPCLTSVANGGTSNQTKLYKCIDRIAALKGVELNNDADIVHTMKRHAETSDLSGQPQAKKPALSPVGS